MHASTGQYHRNVGSERVFGDVVHSAYAVVPGCVAQCRCILLLTGFHLKTTVVSTGMMLRFSMEYTGLRNDR